MWLNLLLLFRCIHELIFAVSPGFLLQHMQAQLIAQSIGQAFSVAYQEFLRANGINPEDLSQKEYSDIINTQEMYNDDLIHFSNSDNCKEVSSQTLSSLLSVLFVLEHSWPSTLMLFCSIQGGLLESSGQWWCTAVLPFVEKKKKKTHTRVLRSF